MSTISAVFTENMQCSIVEARTSFIDLKLDTSLNHGVSLRFVLLLALQTCWATFQAKNNIRSASVLTLVSFGRTMAGAAVVGEKAHLLTKRC